ncbi:MAG: hypothetical protein V5A30_05195 [Haloarculaceae archaeon]
MTEDRDGKPASDDSDGSGSDGAPVDRRDFLRSVAAGVALDRTVVEEAVGRGSELRPTGRDGRLASQHTPLSRRGYLPVESDFLSVRGLAPPQGTNAGGNVWRSGGVFSVADLATEHDLNRDPVSVRELRTPQKSANSFGVVGSGWENWLDDYEQPNAEDVAVSASADRSGLLRTVVRQADDEFRGVGSGHSHSEAAVPEDFFTDIKELEGELPRPWLRDSGDDFWDPNREPNRDPPTRANLIRLRGGTILKKLNRKILPGGGVNGRKPLALPNMGAWDGQTLAGAINTSTHGSGLGLGTFADLVRSVEIITIPESQYESGESHVQMLRVEPSEGVTDPRKFARDAGKHDMVLVQDDDIFHSVVVGYGSMGMVYAYTLELRDPFWLEEQNTFEQWGTFNPYQEAQPSNNRHYQFLVNIIQPQLEVFTGTAPSNASPPLCMVRRRNEVPAGNWDATERFNTANEVEQYVNAFQNAYQRFDASDLNNLNFSAGLNRVLNFDIRDLVAPDPPFKARSGGNTGEDKTASYIALRRKQDLNPNDPKKAEPPVDTITTEIAVPASDVAPAVDAVIDFALNNPRLLPAPLGVRFTASSEHFFSPEYGRETAMLELPIPLPDTLEQEFSNVNTVHDLSGPFGGVYTKPKKIFFQKLKKLNQDIRKAKSGDPHNVGPGFLDHMLSIDVAKAELEKLEDRLVNGRFNGRPHMGKHNTVDVNSSRSYMRPGNMYPEYDKWLDAYRYFNHPGTFDGTFTDNKTP